MRTLTGEIMLILPQHLMQIAEKLEVTRIAVQEVEAAVENLADAGDVRHSELANRLANIEQVLSGRGVAIPDAAFRSAVTDALKHNPGASDRELVEAIEYVVQQHEVLVAKIAQIEAFDNRVAAIKAEADEALREYDHERVAQLFADARRLTNERTVELARRAAEFASAEADAHLIGRNWEKACQVWRDAFEKLYPYDGLAAEQFLEDGTSKLVDFGENYAGGALMVAAEQWEELATRSELRGDLSNSARFRVNLASALCSLGRLASGVEGMNMIASAIAANKGALEIITEEVSPTEWATAQNNLGATLSIQAERTGGSEGLRQLGEAIDAYNAALRVRTEAAFPEDWAAIQNNLGCALFVQGESAGGSDSPELLAKAADAHRAALESQNGGGVPERLGIDAKQSGQCTSSGRRANRRDRGSAFAWISGRCISRSTSGLF